MSDFANKIQKEEDLHYRPEPLVADSLDEVKLYLVKELERLSDVVENLPRAAWGQLRLDDTAFTIETTYKVIQPYDAPAENESQLVALDETAGTMQLETGADGHYRIDISLIAEIPGAAETYDFSLRRNGAVTAVKSLSSTNGSAPLILIAHGFARLAQGDVLDIVVKSAGANRLVTFNSVNFTIHRIR